MWLDNLKEYKKLRNRSSKWIAEQTNLPERTVARIFAGETDNPYVDTIRRIAAVLDVSLDDIFAEGGAVVGGKKLEELQNDVNRLEGENAILQAENVVLKDKLVALTSENDLLRLKLEHKEEIISLHNYYNKLKSN